MVIHMIFFNTRKKKMPRFGVQQERAKSEWEE